MKEWGAIIIGVAFAAALITGFFLGKVPLEVFAPIATACILWFFREREMARLLKSIQNIIKVRVLKSLEEKLKK